MEMGDNNISFFSAWTTLLHEELEKPYVSDLFEKVGESYRSSSVCPPQEKIFRALELCAPSDVRVVILGQDPYHTPNVADGLAFSSLPHNAIPQSLKNIYKEIEREYGVTCPRTSDLSLWAKQGVLLLNASLTVESGRANSHVKFGWHEFTDAVIRTVSRECPHVVFMLWGNYAREKRSLIDSGKHLILESSHPSPLSAHRGFLGNGHFKKANEYLVAHEKGEIRWCGEEIEVKTT